MNKVLFLVSVSRIKEDIEMLRSLVRSDFNKLFVAVCDDGDISALKEELEELRVNSELILNSEAIDSISRNFALPTFLLCRIFADKKISIVESSTLIDSYMDASKKISKYLWAVEFAQDNEIEYIAEYRLSFTPKTIKKVVGDDVEFLYLKPAEIEKTTVVKIAVQVAVDAAVLLKKQKPRIANFRKKEVSDFYLPH